MATKEEKTKESTPTEESTSTSKVPLSEEFQREVMALVSKASDDECDFICDLAYKRRDALREEKEVSMDDYEKVMAPESAAD